MQSDQTIIRKNHMRQLYHTTELIGIKDKHITLNKVFQRETPIEVFATLDYPPPKCKHCKGVQIKYDSQKHSKIPFIEIGGFPSLIRLKKEKISMQVLSKSGCSGNKSGSKKLSDL
ncbi:transposase, ISSmu2 [Streptococcus pyogenes]|nr:transposase, ISSmu2 [Streptococcus pyogenes]VGS50460.1 transposase, ISSmu2 [Streptococcus pyogenes]VGS53416.1 transposase, ISSmu2 [Streptococcus pyogenes]VGS84582.1 transposase, ISSmu2 [Streptococcus pyogenes]VGU38421.1 transposase, ISSmu2 [Streptococcus pyogenes]